MLFGDLLYDFYEFELPGFKMGVLSFVFVSILILWGSGYGNYLGYQYVIIGFGGFECGFWNAVVADNISL